MREAGRARREICLSEEFEVAAGPQTVRWELEVTPVSPLSGPMLGLDELALAPVTAGPSLAEALGEPGWTVSRAIGLMD